jgi:hypothetical protein
MSAKSLDHALIGRPVADANPALLAFLKAKVNTFIKWDLVNFFHQNPHTTDTADNLARYVGRNAAEIVPELDALATSGILAAQTIGGLLVYTLRDDPVTRDLIARFFAACEDRQFRMRATYYMIRSADH